MSFAPHITVACVIEKDNRFLFVEEKTEHGIVLNQPAGHVEAGETVFDAAKREVLEETAWDVELTAITGLYYYTSPTNNVTYQRICFAATALQFFAERPLDQGIIQTHWLTLPEITALSAKHRSPMVMQCLQDYHRNRRFPLALVTHL